MHVVSLQSPAKINLSLRVVGREPSGYHQLVTVFHRISLCDRLVLKKRADGFRLRCSDASIPVDERNLVTQAYGHLRQRFPKLGGVDVSLTKRIPAGGGLGGGSSNAATFLLGANRLYRLGLSTAVLCRIGSQIGADVPFFIHNVRHALAKGRGDKIFPKSLSKRYWFLIVFDPEKLITKDVYQNLPGRLPAASLTKVSREARMLSDFLAEKKLAQAKALIINDLEVPALALRPSIGRTMKRLRQFDLEIVRMSGSGPTVFSVFQDKKRLSRALERIRKSRFCKNWVVCHSF